MILPRRAFLLGAASLLAGRAIVRAESLMAIWDRRQWYGLQSWPYDRATCMKPLPLLLALSIEVASTQAFPHSQWADGSSIPSWVAQSCCGPADSHQLGPDDYWVDAQGFHIKGLVQVKPLSQVQPSQDGQVWAFYNSRLGADATVYCVFYSGSI